MHLQLPCFLINKVEMETSSGQTAGAVEESTFRGRALSHKMELPLYSQELIYNN